MTGFTGPVPGTGNRRALGTDSELEYLARKVRRAGGRVEISQRTHLVWTLPDGAVLRSGLTMNKRSVRNLTRDLRRGLGLGR